LIPALAVPYSSRKDARMSFMQPDVQFGRYFLIEANHGETHLVPADVCNGETAGDFADYVQGKIDDPESPVESIEGWYGRMSAPGYLDCTDWTWGDTEKEVRDTLAEYYGDDESDESGESQIEPGSADWNIIEEIIGRTGLAAVLDAIERIKCAE
jgi:hypothetical protein